MPQRPRAPHLNVVIFCSLLRVHKHLEASLTNIEMGVPGALMETVGSKIPSSVTRSITQVDQVEPISHIGLSVATRRGGIGRYRVEDQEWG